MTEVFFNSSAGRIEARYFQSSAKSPLALILHPHPLYKGSMNNNVVYALYKIFAKNGFSVLRINFRGVGKSQGTFNNGVGELIDAATALDWLQVNNNSHSGIWIAGFSFGSWIGMQVVMRRPEVAHFLVVSPPVNKHDFTFLAPCPVSGLIIHGDQDSVVQEDTVTQFVNRISQHKHVTIAYKCIQGADHFFRDKIDNLSQVVDEYVQYQILNLLNADPLIPKWKKSKNKNTNVLLVD